jgi:hypothetical protein
MASTMISASRRHRLAHRVLHGHDGGAVRRHDYLIELRLRVGDPAVLGHRPVLEGITDAFHPGSIGSGCELRCVQSRQRALDRGPAFWGVQLFARGRGEHEIQHAALLGRELGLDQIGRALRVGAGDFELVAQATPDGRDQHHQAGDDPYPGDDDSPRVRCAQPRPPS